MVSQIFADVIVILFMLFVRIVMPFALVAVIGHWLEKRLLPLAAESQETTSPKILVVDDDPDFVDLTRTILASRNYQVMTASDGKQAMHVMRTDKPDLTLLDIMMSHLLEGLEVSREMAKDPTLKDLPVIMVTSLTGAWARSIVPSDDYIPMEKWVHKPVDPDLLLSEIESALQRRVPQPALA